MIGYVQIKQFKSLFPVAPQLGIATGKTRIRNDGEVEAEFVPLNRGDYVGKTWLTRNQIY